MVLLSSTHKANQAIYPVPRWKESSELRILSWNIYLLPYISLFNNNDQRAKAIAEQLNGSDYHIIVFQEAFSSKCRNIMSQILLASFPFQYGPANDSRFSLRTNSGLWIVSKIPLTQLDQLQFSVSKGFDVVARKGAVLLEGCFKGSKFQLLATHLQAKDSQALREKQCAEIKEHLLNPFFRKDTPQFLCGDFNIDMQDTTDYHQMLQILDATNGQISGNMLVTYDEVNNNLAYKPNGKKRILDYALVRNEGLIEKMERRVQTFLSGIGDGESHLSDHYAMDLSINFPETSTH
ncbi:MAG: endonuclease/exonuclease/phosphatase family protein [Bacteroidia bacterium]|nr:endonuclease/exonuclease/phosphatase family protein [Bacteroidia bacterium]